MKNVTKEELGSIKEMLTTFNNLKMQLGDAVLSQNTIVAKIDSLKEEYSELEKVLANKYGKDSRIDVQTGEIKEKEK
jgi:hypothetical protein